MSAASPLRKVAAWHLLVIVSISVAFQSLFIHHGIGWLFDEGWPLYAAMQLQGGGVLYGDVLFPFPPGHLLVAWIAYAVDPPGILFARLGYASLDVALCVGFYFLARRLCSPGFAFIAALLLAVAAPRSQLAHLLFGYRYLIFSVLVLLVLDRRLREPDAPPRRAAALLFLAGVLTGVALYFRLTPAFAVSCGVGAALWASSPCWRSALRESAAYAGGLALVAVPVLAWFASTVGLDVLWREVVTRIVALQTAQSLASPAFFLLPPSADRDELYRWWVAFQYRAFIGLYAGYALFLAGSLWRSLRAGRRFEHGLLLAVVVWGAIYLLRTLGRSDDHHLMSALPPAILVATHGVEAALSSLLRRGGRAPRPRGVRTGATVALGLWLLFGWVYLQRVDLFLHSRYRGTAPIQSTGGRISVTRRAEAEGIDAVVRAVHRFSAPEDRILDLTGSPLLHPLSGRRGPGRIDVISPGIFLNDEEERSFVEHLASRPPALVVWPAEAFDGHPERGIDRSAPRLARWVRANYRQHSAAGRYRILRPTGRLQGVQ